MRKSLILAIVMAISSTGFATNSMKSVSGAWQNIPDEGAEAGTFEITINDDNSLSAKITKVAAKIENPKCDKCTGSLKDAPIIGLQILDKLPYAGDNVWTGGQILDPESGKFYKVKLTLQDDGKKIKVRGYIGTPAFGRTQYWVRAK